MDENEWWNKLEGFKKGGEQEMIIKRCFKRDDQEVLSDMAHQLGLYLYVLTYSLRSLFFIFRQLYLHNLMVKLILKNTCSSSTICSAWTGSFCWLSVVLASLSFSFDNRLFLVTWILSCGFWSLYT